MDGPQKLLLPIIVGSLLLPVFALANGGGKFFSALIGQGAPSDRYSSFSGDVGHGPDVLNVSQLAQCIVKARKLDEDSRRMEFERAKLNALASSITAYETKMSSVTVVVTSQRSVETFNVLFEGYKQLVQIARTGKLTFDSAARSHSADVIAYSAECDKKYYISDLESANALAGAR